MTVNQQPKQNMEKITMSRESFHLLNGALASAKTMANSEHFQLYHAWLEEIEQARELITHANIIEPERGTK